ncbi:DUF2490 domain-containing protein [Porphyrobacter sp. GA68]|uniref:DUF2490 domain-containing protein n=1 Tax=Porphyrobacter sp. GA68 TaxID=2883480 RepID=UPI001D187080|nr:DUF2490 domain-containing protein [Porphyrobacter sp. GA68]
MPRTLLSISLIALALPLAAPAAASDEDFELWLNPTTQFDLDDDTAVQLETAQRFRDADRGRVDTYYGRFWVKQQIGDGLRLDGGIERRINDGGADETRLLQQLNASSGILRGRLRSEQRFREGTGGRMGLRLRSRIGVAVPLSEDGRWTADASGELFWTLRGTSAGGDTGLTGLRTVIGVEYAVSDNVAVNLSYLRNQDFTDNAPDVIGHAPLIGIDFSF